MQGSKDNSVLPKDVKQVLQHGDCFGLLPDQLYYKVSYRQVNGKTRYAFTRAFQSNCFHAVIIQPLPLSTIEEEVFISVLSLLLVTIYFGLWN